MPSSARRLLLEVEVERRVAAAQAAAAQGQLEAPHGRDDRAEQRAPAFSPSSRHAEDAGDHHHRRLGQVLRQVGGGVYDPADLATRPRPRRPGRAGSRRRRRVEAASASFLAWSRMTIQRQFCGSTRSAPARPAAGTRAARRRAPGGRGRGACAPALVVVSSASTWARSNSIVGVSPGGPAGATRPYDRGARSASGRPPSRDAGAVQVAGHLAAALDGRPARERARGTRPSRSGSGC